MKRRCETSGIPAVVAVNDRLWHRRLGFGRLIAALLFVVAVGPFGCDGMPMAGFGGAGGWDGSTDLDASTAPSLEGAAANERDQVARDIEEADIVKVVGDKLYALNRFKGLLIVDVSDPDAPEMVGELELRGGGIEMYVMGSRAYVLLSAAYRYAFMSVEPMIAPGPMPPIPEFEGSRLAIVDVSDATAPALLGKLNLAGFANESRRVGDVIYVIGRTYIPFRMGMGMHGEDDLDEGFVASINVSDPNDIVPVERETFTGNAIVMHVSDSAIFAASREYDFDAGETATRVQIIDISDPAGTIALRGSMNVPGTIRNRFYMDEYQGVLRVASESWGFGFREVRLYTYDLSDLDQATKLGEVEIIQGETLEAVRFDGPRGYVVTFLQLDPLFVLDLSDPTEPAVKGHLEVPGFSTHIEPRGNRLIAVGIDDTDGRRPAVSYYDVEDPASPTELGRVVLGPPGSFTSSEAVFDEKAFKIVDELGLIAIPFKHVDYSGGWSAADDEILPGEAWEEDALAYVPPECVNAVQLVDFDDSGLSQRGWFEHRGLIRRVGVIGDRVFALSDVALQTVDIADRDNPVKAGQADFFDEDNLPFYADDCGGFDFAFDMPGIEFGPSFPLLIRIFLDSEMCGTFSALPAAMLPVCLLAVKMSATPRRRRRRSPLGSKKR